MKSALANASPCLSRRTFPIRMREAGAYSDETLAAQLQSGNADALTVLFKRHSPLLFGIARRILSNDAEAEDTVQQIFLDVFRSIQQFDAREGDLQDMVANVHVSTNIQQSSHATCEPILRHGST